MKKPMSHRITAAIRTYHSTWTAKPKPPKMARITINTMRAAICSSFP